MSTIVDLLYKSSIDTPERVVIYLQRSGLPDLPITYKVCTATLNLFN